MAFRHASLLIFLFLFNILTLGHPGHDHKREAAERAAYLKGARARSLSHCSEKLRVRGMQQRSIERRQALANSIRIKRGLPSKPYLKARDVDTVLATSHHSNLTGITLDTPETTIFADNSSCVLQPDSVEGPYYVTGESIRKNVTNGQPGVPLTVDVQIVDPTTCDIVPNVYMDFWSANATGVYGGVVATGNGNSNDATNLNSTAFRGIQQTDSEGVAQFETVVPGHYTGRTNHLHVLTHTTNTTVNVNGTINAVTATHVGQIFFDQDLLTQVEATTPYNTNTQNITTNAEDAWLIQEAESSDPMLKYVLLGDSVEDGLLGWITIGIDTTEVRTVAAAGNYGSDGGSSNGNGSGGFAPTGVVPSGGAPTGTSAAFKL
ncbi:MAG: hypothetical protein Q9160_003232 [Pyrenula sp. 1 TL-2023]